MSLHFLPMLYSRGTKKRSNILTIRILIILTDCSWRHVIYFFFHNAILIFNLIGWLTRQWLLILIEYNYDLKLDHDETGFFFNFLDLHSWMADKILFNFLHFFSFTKVNNLFWSTVGMKYPDKWQPSGNFSFDNFLVIEREEEWFQLQMRILFLKELLLLIPSRTIFV